MRKTCVEIHALMNHLQHGVYCESMPQIMYARTFFVADKLYIAPVKYCPEIKSDRIGSDWETIQLYKIGIVGTGNLIDRYSIPERLIPP